MSKINTSKTTQKIKNSLQVPKKDNKTSRSSITTANSKSFNSLTSLDDIDTVYQKKGTLSDPTSFKTTDLLLEALKNEISSEINEANTVMIQSHQALESQIKPTENNLQMFRGFLALLSDEFLIDEHLFKLTWSNLLGNDHDSRPSVQGYLRNPYEITQNLMKIATSPIKVISEEKVEKIGKYFSENSSIYEQFIANEKNAIFQPVLYNWMSVFVQIIKTLMYVSKIGDYKRSESKPLKEESEKNTKSGSYNDNLSERIAARKSKIFTHKNEYSREQLVGEALFEASEKLSNQSSPQKNSLGIPTLSVLVPSTSIQDMDSIDQLRVEMNGKKSPQKFSASGDLRGKISEFIVNVSEAEDDVKLFSERKNAYGKRSFSKFDMERKSCYDFGN